MKRFPWLLLALALPSCGHRTAPASRSVPADTAVARAIARDRPQRLVLPLAPAGAGRMSFAAVAPARADLDSVAAGNALDLPPPAAEIAPPPMDTTAPAADGSGTPELKPPIPRGTPRLARGGRGGSVTLDVRVDEAGEVSDVVIVSTDADSATVRAAENAAEALRYFPALLGQRRVAVWTRQVFEVARGR
jgi:TonB family protein